LRLLEFTHAIVRDAMPGEAIAAIGVREMIGLISGSFVGLGLWSIGEKKPVAKIEPRA
jgi:hypothetical protein